MKTKFKEGDEIFFISGNTPKKSVVEGVMIVFGTFKSAYKTIKGTEDEPAICYSMASYDEVDEKNAFASAESLKESLFSKLEADTAK